MEGTNEQGWQEHSANLPGSSVGAWNVMALSFPSIESEMILRKEAETCELFPIKALATSPQHE